MKNTKNPERQKLSQENNNIINKLKQKGCDVRIRHYRRIQDVVCSVDNGKGYVVTTVSPKTNDYFTHSEVKSFEKLGVYADISPRGGKTVVEVSLPEAKSLNKRIKVESVCSDKDNFFRIYGTNLTLKRLPEQLTSLLA